MRIAKKKIFTSLHVTEVLNLINSATVVDFHNYVFEIDYSRVLRKEPRF